MFVALYDVTEQDAVSMDRWEAADLALFRKLRVRVHTLDGDVLAWLYVLDDYEGGLPSARYLGLIADAAEAAGAPDDYVAELRARPCTSVGRAPVRPAEGRALSSLHHRRQQTDTSSSPGRNISCR